MTKAVVQNFDFSRHLGLVDVMATFGAEIFVITGNLSVFSLTSRKLILFRKNQMKDIANFKVHCQIKVKTRNGSKIQRVAREVSCFFSFLFLKLIQSLALPKLIKTN